MFPILQMQLRIFTFFFIKSCMQNVKIANNTIPYKVKFVNFNLFYFQSEIFSMSLVIIAKILDVTLNESFLYSRIWSFVQVTHHVLYVLKNKITGFGCSKFLIIITIFCKIIHGQVWFRKLFTWQLSKGFSQCLILAALISLLLLPKYQWITEFLTCSGFRCFIFQSLQ